MTDVLIRNVDDTTLSRIDRLAAGTGLSRSEYLRRELDRIAHPQGVATMDDLHRSVALSADVLDDDLMRQAWE